MNNWHTSGNPSLKDYMMGAFRGAYQIDWDYPFSHEGIEHTSSLSATEASKRLIQQFVPDYMFSQHNATIGGWYDLTMEDDPVAAARMNDLMRRVAPNMPHSVSDIPYAKLLAPGVYQMPSTADRYNYYVQSVATKEEIAAHMFGDNSLNYAQRVAQAAGKGDRAYGLIQETPYFSVARRADGAEPSGYTREQVIWGAVQQALDTLVTTGKYIEQVCEGVANPALRPIAEAAQFQYKIWKAELAIEAAAPIANAKEPMSNTERIDNLINYGFYPNLSLAMTARLARELRHPQAAALEQAVAQKAAHLEQVASLTLTSPRTMVQAQVGSLFVSMLSQKEAIDCPVQG
jgi:hypothetical protein